MHNSSNHSAARGWLASLLLVPFVIAAAVFGFFVLLIAVGIIVVVAVVFALRLWWLRRQLQRAMRNRSDALEGEYVVVRETVRPNERLR